MPTITFANEHRSIDVLPGTNLRKAALKAGVQLYSPLARVFHVNLELGPVALHSTSDVVEVLEAKGIPARNEAEEALVAGRFVKRKVAPNLRLASQITVNGDITVHNVEGFVEAQTLNGNVKQTGVAGSILAHTVNGSVDVALRALPEAPGGLQLETINGDLRLLLPAAANAELELSTVAGRIESDLLAPTRALAGDTSSTRARLGRGGVTIRLRTIRGNIEVAENDGLL